MLRCELAALGVELPLQLRRAVEVDEVNHHRGSGARGAFCRRRPFLAADAIASRCLLRPLLPPPLARGVRLRVRVRARLRVKARARRRIGVRIGGRHRRTWVGVGVGVG